VIRGADIDAAVRAVDPVDPDAVGALPLAEARRELFAGIVAEPQELPAKTGEWVGRARGRRRPVRRGAYLALGGVAAVACALVLVVGGSGVGPAGSPALGAGFVRLADHSPHVLMKAPGWRMFAARQEDSGEGAMEFSHVGKRRAYLGGHMFIEPASTVVLEWQAPPPSGPIHRPSRDASFIGTVVALGAKARLYVRHEAAEPGFIPIRKTEYGAIWDRAGRRITVHSDAPSLTLFKSRLSALQTVGRRPWLAAVPGHLVTRGRTISALAPGEGTIGFRCVPLTPALAAGEPNYVVAFYHRQCGKVLHPKAEP
jgi:hypothetical protein